MTKQVRCISPHGGCRNGRYHDGRPVEHVWTQPPEGSGEPAGYALPDVPAEKLRLPPNEGGYVDDARIPGGVAAVGQVYDVDDGFYADGFHWEEVAKLAGKPPAPPAPPPPAPDTKTPGE